MVRKAYTYDYPFLIIVELVEQELKVLFPAHNDKDTFWNYCIISTLASIETSELQK